MPVGPQSISKPAGAIDIWPGQSIQQAIAGSIAGATFWLRTGVHPIFGPITPKATQSFVGELGAAIDGEDWSSSNLDDAAFKALNLDIDNVTIKNLVIRNMPQKGIMAYRDFSSGWVIDYNEVHACKTGVEIPPGAKVRFNYIHHNLGDVDNVDAARRGGGLVGNQANGSVIEDNEIAYNGPEQKMILSQGVAFRRNFVHHHAKDGIWFDGGGAALVEENIVEDNGRDGIVLEHVTGGGLVRRNICKRNGEAILLADARSAEVYENTLEDNAIALCLFKDFNDFPERDLLDIIVRHNLVRVPGVGGGIYAVVMQFLGNGDQTPYLSGAKKPQFVGNTYQLVTPTDAVFMWGGAKTFPQWQALGFDTDVPVPPEPSEPPEQPAVLSCTLDGQTYDQGATSEVTVKRSSVSDWTADHPEWQVTSTRPHPKKKQHVILTVECQP